MAVIIYEDFFQYLLENVDYSVLGKKNKLTRVYRASLTTQSNLT